MNNTIGVYLRRANGSAVRVVCEMLDRRVGGRGFSMRVAALPPGGRVWVEVPNPEATAADILAAVLVLGITPTRSQVGDQPAMPVYAVFEESITGARLPIALARLVQALDQPADIAPGLGACA